MRACPVCRQTYDAGGTKGRPRAYCSDRCKERARWDRRAKTPEKTYSAVCVADGCGCNAFEGRYGCRCGHGSGDHIDLREVSA